MDFHHPLKFLMVKKLLGPYTVYVKYSDALNIQYTFLSLPNAYGS